MVLRLCLVRTGGCPYYKGLTFDENKPLVLVLDFFQPRANILLTHKENWNDKWRGLVGDKLNGRENHYEHKAIKSVTDA